MARRPRPPLLKRLWEDSQTKYLAFTQAVSGAVLVSASELNDAVSSPVISNALNSLNLPSWFPWLLLGLACLTYVAHGHSDDA